MGAPTTVAPAPGDDEDEASGFNWWWLVVALILVGIALAAWLRSRRKPREPSADEALAAAAQRARDLADGARLIATTTDTNALAFRWAQFDRDHDDLGRQLTALGSRPEVAADAASLQQAASDLAAAVAYDRDLRLGGAATADQLSYARAGVLERAEAVTAAAGPPPDTPPQA